MLEPAAYGRRKDASAAWAAGVLTVGGGPMADENSERSELPEDFWEGWNERVAIMVVDGGVPHAEAERVALVALQAQRATRTAMQYDRIPTPDPTGGDPAAGRWRQEEQKDAARLDRHGVTEAMAPH